MLKKVLFLIFVLQITTKTFTVGASDELTDDLEKQENIEENIDENISTQDSTSVDIDSVDDQVDVDDEDTSQLPDDVVSKDDTILLEHNNNKNQLKNSYESSAWQFKYTEEKKQEPGFDLSLEEITKFKIWENGIIPYYIDAVSFSDKVLRDKIRNFLQIVNSVTSVNFVELQSPPDDENERWVFFMNRRGQLGCADHTVKNFSNRGVQQVVLGYDCMATKGELAEAVMSILGIPAQHNAPDRDKYIEINIDNILPEKKYLFEKIKDNEWLFHDTTYDYNSITHYDLNKYSANGHTTLILKKSTEDFKPATAFSALDLRKIKMLYNYITAKKNIQSPVCKEMFQVGNKRDRGKKRLKPRKKPNRYLGISVLQNHESEDEKENSELNVDDNYNLSRYDGTNEENDNKKNHKYKIKSLSNKHRFKVGFKVRKHHKKRKQKSKVKKLPDFYWYPSGSDENLTEEESDEPDDLKRVQLKSKIKLDPLALLSDYHTDNQ